MNGFETVNHKGTIITIVDLSNTKTLQAIQLLKEAQKKITTMPPKSVRLITDVTNAEVTKEVVNAIMAYAKSNTPFLKASGVVGAEKLKSVITLNVSTTVGRTINNFGSRTEAKDWLASQQ